MSRRLEKEFADLEYRPDEQDRFFVETRYRTRENPTWKCHILLENDQTSYRDVVVEVVLLFPQEYPFKPPKVHFRVPVFHPYIHSDGEMCRKVLSFQWWGERDEITGHPSNNSVRWVLGFLHDMFVDEGRSIDVQMNPLPSTQQCRLNYHIIDTRDHNYMMFDKIIQRTLGRELLNDKRIEDQESFVWSDLGEWDKQIRLQRYIDDVQTTLLDNVFDGSHPSLHAIAKQYLGIASGDRERLTSLHILEEVRAPQKNVTFVSSDGKRIRTHAWTCLHLIDLFDTADDIPIPFDSANIFKLLGLCRERNSFVLRVYNPTTHLPDLTHISTTSMGDVVEMAKIAAFFSADRIVHECCLKLSLMIRMKSRSVLAGQRTAFKTYVNASQ
ncbi:ubiquitin-conjugating enzyme E2 [bacterium]|nr:ubiquitin-conjugating enzyme E2 [bacterium]